MTTIINMLLPPPPSFPEKKRLQIHTSVCTYILSVYTMNYVCTYVAICTYVIIFLAANTNAVMYAYHNIITPLL